MTLRARLDFGYVAGRPERRFVRIEESNATKKMGPGILWRGIAALAVGMLALSAAAKEPLGQGWKKHENLKPVIGADGKPHAATCSGYPGTDSKFSFWTKPGKSKNLAVFFEGGGACWDNLTCTFPIDDAVAQLNTTPGVPAAAQIPQFFVPAIDANTNPANYDGIFKADNPKNPIKDWTMVYIPYCTGDLHTGSTTKNYFSARAAVRQSPLAAALPPLPTAFPIEHRGFDNFMVVLDWMKKNVDKPKNVLVTGTSAGGYGATANFPWIERTFRNAHTYVLADASQGVTVPGFDTGNPGRNSWNMQLDPQVFGTNPSSIAGPDLLRVAAEALPHVKTAQFTTAFDIVQIQFYAVMKLLYQDPGTCSNPAYDWHNRMVGTLQSYASEVDNYRYYVADGTYHTLLRSPQFYAENSTGVNFSDWVEDMLENRGGARGHGGGWENEACASCLVQLPCP